MFQKKESYRKLHTTAKEKNGGLKFIPNLTNLENFEEYLTDNFAIANSKDEFKVYSSRIDEKDTIVLRVPSEFYDTLALLNLPQLKLQSKNEGRKTQLILVDCDEAEILHHIHCNRDLILFADAIRKLQEKGIDEASIAAYKNLLQALAKTGTDLNKSPNDVVLAYFRSLAESHLTGNLDKAWLELNAQNLDEQLYGKPPLSPALKALICLLLAAVLGFGVGAIVCALITSGGASFGDFVNALTTISEDAILGTTISTATAASVGGTLGFLSGKHHQQAYELNRDHNVTAATHQLHNALNHA
ncbi:MAG: hypothetical protein QM752_05145 [Gammaproteobacteria bacterium]